MIVPVMNIKIFFIFRLEGQQEDCQNKYGCRVSFLDAEFISKQDQNNFNQLSKVVIDAKINQSVQAIN